MLYLLVAIRNLTIVHTNVLLEYMGDIIISVLYYSLVLFYVYY